jgi:hypothetical protein
MLRQLNAGRELVMTFLGTLPHETDKSCDDTVFGLRWHTLETRNMQYLGIAFTAEELTMRKLVFSMGAIAIAFMVAFAWSHTVLAPSQASTATSINPTDMMTNYKGSLPIEQWEAI